MAYPTISTVAFKLKANLQSQTYYGLKIKNAENARKYLKELTAYRNDKRSGKTNIPVRTLYQALRLLAGLIHIGDLRDDFLVYSPQPIDTEYISAIINYWIDLEFPLKAT